MKKIIFLLLPLMLLMLSLALPVLPSAAAGGDVTLSDNDLAAALGSVADGGTVTVNGTCTVPAGFVWPTYGKSVTVTGGTLDLSGMGTTVNFGGNVTFEGMTLTMAANATVYANGHAVTVKEDVTVTNAVTAIYGGGATGTTVASTDLTLLSGDYKSIYGGSNGGTVTGDTNVYVGGRVNSDCDWTSHSATYSVYGGGNADTVKGSTHMTFTGGAKANYIWGGSKGAATIEGDKYATMSGGYTMSFYGGNSNADTGAGSHNYVTVTGGKLEQLFGGNQAAPMTGNVVVRVLGGEVVRRIYGGCYNEATRSGLSVNWGSAHYVTGNVTLVIGRGVTLTLNHSSGDCGIFAISRQKTRSDTENGVLVFADEAAYSSYSDKMGAQDFGGIWIMGTGNAADSTHTLSHSASGAVVTETCDALSHTATATLTMTESGPFYCTGEALTPAAEVVYSEAWLGDPLTLAYADNVNAGTGKITATAPDGIAAMLSFTVEKRATAAPTLSAEAETVRGKADGTIRGLNVHMEWKPLNGIDFTPVTDPQMTLAAGTYLVRYAERELYKASPVTTVTVNEGAPIVVTFTADGNVIERRELSWHGSLSMDALPAITPKTGHENAPPYWDVTAEALTDMEADLTVTAVYTKDRYTVTLPAAQVGYTLTASTTTPDYDDTVTLTLSLAAGYDKTEAFSLCLNGDAVTPMGDRYTFTATEDVTVTVAGIADITPPVIGGFVSGGAAYGDLTFTVTEATPYVVRIDGEVAETHTVMADNALHTVSVTDAAGNVSTCTVTVYRIYTVTFTVDGRVLTTCQVGHGQGVADIPEIPAREGFTATAPRWDAADLSTVTEDMTVTAVYTADPEEELLPPAQIQPDREEITEDHYVSKDPADEGSGSTAQSDGNGNADGADTAKEGESTVLVTVIVIVAVAALAVGGVAVAAVVLRKRKGA